MKTIPFIGVTLTHLGMLEDEPIDLDASIERLRMAVYAHLHEFYPDTWISVTLLKSGGTSGVVMGIPANQDDYLSYEMLGSRIESLVAEIVERPELWIVPLEGVMDD